MLIWLYRLLYLPALVVLAPHYLWRMRRRGGYSAKFAERLGALDGVPARRPGVRRVWLQAVSVGEILAVVPLLEAWQRQGGVEVWLTTTTSTGRKLAHERLGGLVAGCSWFPLDFWPVVARTWRRLQPDVIVLMEGERWPEQLWQARRRGVPVVCINARMSDRSFRRLRALRFLAPVLFGPVDLLLAASQHDAERFGALGVAPSRLGVTGNMKLDVNLRELTADERAALRSGMGLAGEDVPVVLGSSTWPGEEAALLAALPRLRAVDPGVKLVIVPRHAERRAELVALLEKSGLRWHLRSRGPASTEVDVLVADTTGELQSIAQLATLVFVGKSLPPNAGGQTPVEAAALAKPVLFGPDMSNFRPIAAELLSCGAARRVGSAAELAETLVSLLATPAERSRMAAAAYDWHRANRGAVSRTMARLADFTLRR